MAWPCSARLLNPYGRRYAVAKRTKDTGASKPDKTGATTSAKSTVSGPTAKTDAPIGDAATFKMAAQEAVAAQFPYNEAKPAEFGKAALAPVAGKAIVPPDPIVGASTLTEANAS